MRLPIRWSIKNYEVPYFSSVVTRGMRGTAGVVCRLVVAKSDSAKN